MRAMTPRQRFQATFVEGRRGCVPRHEDLRDDILAAWDMPDALARVALDRWELCTPDGAQPALDGVVATPDDAERWLALHALGQCSAPTALHEGTEREWVRGMSCYRGLLLTFGVSDGATLADFMLFLADHGDLVERMMRRLADFHVALVAPALAALDVDYLLLAEPIASHHGPVISPAMWSRFCAPYYRRLVDLARAHGVRTVVWESWGQVELLLPLVIATGVDTLCLRHAAGAGIDHLALRERLGPAVGLMGGIDARLLAGPAGALDAALARLMPPLLAGGRFVPMLDDRPRAEMSGHSFVAYRERLEAYLRAVESDGS